MWYNNKPVADSKTHDAAVQVCDLIAAYRLRLTYTQIHAGQDKWRTALKGIMNLSNWPTVDEQRIQDIRCNHIYCGNCSAFNGTSFYGALLNTCFVCQSYGIDAYDISIIFAETGFPAPFVHQSFLVTLNCFNPIQRRQMWDRNHERSLTDAHYATHSRKIKVAELQQQQRVTYLPTQVSNQ